MTTRISGPKGAPDLTPPASALHEELTRLAVDRFARYGYSRIDTPAFEHTELFERGLQSGSDIVTKQMYTFLDRGNRSLTLRPDMTAPVMRAVLEHSLDRAGLPLKLYYVASIFRHERPQSGRFRQFTQVGVEAIGSDGPEIDAEVILLAAEILAGAGMEDAELLLNSVGHPECREAYLPRLREYLSVNADRLCEDCRRKIDTNPLRTFDCKVASDRQVMNGAPLITDYLCSECKEYFDGLKNLLASCGLRFKEQPRLVRGLDYYTRTAFEFVAKGLGSQNAVGAGGRYDGLAEQLGGQRLPGVGFGLGVERIALALKDAHVSAKLQAFVVAVGDRAQSAAFGLVQELRKQGIATDFDHLRRSVKGQFKAADRSGAEYSLVIGDKELEMGELTVKNMATGEEVSVVRTEVAGYVRSSK